MRICHFSLHRTNCSNVDCLWVERQLDKIPGVVFLYARVHLQEQVQFSASPMEKGWVITGCGFPAICASLCPIMIFQSNFQFVSTGLTFVVFQSTFVCSVLLTDLCPPTLFKIVKPKQLRPR